ncbi:Alkaline ceramidase 3 [Boothiomyces sp. JEL0866]|nr:Alkaline ceramidase 3 [Boothiomyces sp. JEL0866]
MVIVGLIGSLFHPKAPLPFHFAFLTTAGVGLGSMAFHATLWKVSQALDEVPMLWSALTFLYIGITQRIQLSVFAQKILGTLLFVHAIFTTVLVTAFEGEWQFKLFHLSFSTAEICAIGQVISVYLKRRRANGGDIVTKLCIRGLFMYALAVFLWGVEVFWCEYLNPWYPEALFPVNFHLHAWWHILVSFGLYLMSCLMLVESVEAKQELHAELNSWYGIPYVHFEKNKRE